MKINLHTEIIKSGSRVRHTAGPQWETSFADIQVAGGSYRIWDVCLQVGDTVFVQGTIKGDTITHAYVERRGQTAKGQLKNIKWYSSSDHKKFKLFLEKGV